MPARPVAPDGPGVPAPMIVSLPAGRRACRPLVLAAVIVLAPLAALAGSTVPLAAEAPPEVRQVIVQPGDTLSDIAVRFYGTADAVARLAAANGITDTNRILAGTTLRLPPLGGEASRSAVPAGERREVVVQPGDTLSAISERLYGTAAYAALLAELNGIADPNLVVAGSRLIAPTTPPVAAVSRPGRGGPLAGRRICLDPGHGGVAEPGAVFTFPGGRALREADVTLDISRTLRAWLEADGATVTMTRTADIFLGLDQRAYICNAAGADIAVSVHLNGDDNPARNGALSLFAKVIDRRLAERLATALQIGLGRNPPGVPFFAFGARQFDGALLLRTTMPAVIVEPVFLTNPGEAEALLAPTAQAGSRRNQIVLETYRGIRMYFADVGSR
jgi:N-acetylmuramoyl-L-alanine amidase